MRLHAKLHKKTDDLVTRDVVTSPVTRKRAKKEGWTRDLAGKIAAKAEALVTKDAVTRRVTKNDLVMENELVEANAELQANVISVSVVLRASGSWHAV